MNINEIRSDFEVHKTNNVTFKGDLFVNTCICGLSLYLPPVLENNICTVIHVVQPHYNLICFSGATYMYNVLI